MFIYWGSNIAGKTRGQVFMIKGQPFLNGYVSARLVPTGANGKLCVTITGSGPVISITGAATTITITGSAPSVDITGEGC